MTLSNRTLAILVLIGVFGFFYLIYIYFFVYYTSTLHITSNVDNYKVELYAKDYAQKFERDCVSATCSLTDISPFDYSITIFKDQYEPYTTFLDLKGATTVDIAVTLKKKISLSKVEPVESDPLLNKVELLKAKAGAYLLYDMKEFGVFYFEENSGKLTLYTFENKQPLRIGDFNSYTKEEISLTKVYGDTQMIVISFGEENFLYDVANSSLGEIDMSVPILYAKTGEKENTFQLITDKGTFDYDRSTGEVTYFTLFYDYLTTGTGTLVGYLAGDDVVRRTNFGYSKDEFGETPLLIEYKQETLDKTVFFQLPSSAAKIYRQQEKVFLEDREGNIFEVTGM